MQADQGFARSAPGGTEFELHQGHVAINPKASAVQLNERLWLRKLTVVVLVKLAVLAALWWAFVRDQVVAADSSTTAERLLDDAPAPDTEPASPAPHGHHNSKDRPDDFRPTR